ncbi:MAG: SMI1/KNR4 family protein [Gemmataceae bacterium]
MAKKVQYRKGEQWEFKTPVAEFENIFVIGAVIEAEPEFGWDERKYEVYVRYSEAAKEHIPADYDGTILSLNDEGLDRSVTKLVKSNVKLPWWWVYGRRFESKKDAPSGRGTTQCDFVSESLPGIFRSAKQRAEDARAQAEALRKHHEKFDSRKKPKPSKSIAESWKRIEGWYAENVRPIGKSLAHGASKTAISRFEKAIGAKLPDDFKESVLIHDGGGWWLPCKGELLSLEEILKQWTMYSEWQAKADYATDNWRADDIKGPIKPVFWNKKRIYVTDNSGDHLTLDLDPPENGKYGQVLHHSHEVGPTDVVASGWGEFLRQLVDDLESGKYVSLERYGGSSLELVADLENESM